MGAGKRAIRIAFGKNHPIHRGNQNAQAIVELALILPILLVLIVGALEFGRLWSTKVILTNAAREGAYYYATHSAPSNCSGTASSSVIASQNEAKNSGLTLNSGDVSVAGSSCIPGSTVKVTTTTTVNNLLILGFVGNVFRITNSISSMTLTSSVEMMVQ
ncbi:MAG: TadE/TadG family type IV pilus assembly protein [Anaerolineaceae bacterium]|jgi:TadE-like protein.